MLEHLRRGFDVFRTARRFLLDDVRHGARGHHHRKVDPAPIANVYRS